jgi:hypothetical protein
MSPSIAVFGVGPGLGQAIARRYARQVRRRPRCPGRSRLICWLSDLVWEMPTVDAEHLADLLWTMHRTRSQPEAIYPAR